MHREQSTEAGAQRQRWWVVPLLLELASVLTALGNGAGGGCHGFGASKTPRKVGRAGQLQVHGMGWHGSRGRLDK